MSAAAIPRGGGASVDAELLIAQRAQLLKANMSADALSALPGGFLMKPRGNGQEIADSRAYVEGDDLRHVDRGATARTGKLHIRTFHEERDRVTFLVADFRPSMLWGMRRALRSVVAAEVLARLGWQAVEAGGRVGLLAISARGTVLVQTRGRVRGMLAVVGGLVKAHAMAIDAAREGLDDEPLDQHCKGLARVVPRGAAIVFASSLDTRGREFADVVSGLARRRHPRFLVIEDRALQELPPGRYPLVMPGGTRMSANINRKLSPAPPLEGQGIEGYPTLHLDAGAEISNRVLVLGR